MMDNLFFCHASLLPPSPPKKIRLSELGSLVNVEFVFIICIYYHVTACIQETII